MFDSFSPNTIYEARQFQSYIDVDPNERSGEWVAGKNVEPLYRLKAKLPGDFAIRFGAIVIVILVIAYK